MRFLAFILFSLLSALGLSASARATTTHDVYGITFKTIDGKSLTLDQFKGKVILIVNTASRCGFTKQYAGLEKLYETYKDKGLVVLGVPSNDFANQEPGSSGEIKKFCETNFNITFPLMDKVAVIGDDAHPFFKQVREELGFLARPHWNFYKYLIGRDGHIVAWYGSTTKPDSDDLIKAVEAELAKGQI
jgi:glutathione peroxidase